MEEVKRLKEGFPYFVTNKGSVISYGFKVKCRGGERQTGNRILKPCIRNGYESVRLNITGSFKWYTIHRLVAFLFVENPLKYLQVNHKDGVKTNNDASNLEWCNQSQNTKHAYDNKLLIPPGNRKGFCGKLNTTSKPVIQLDKNGMLIKEYESSNLTKINGFIPSCVRRVCQGALKQHKGFIWKYI